MCRFAAREYWKWPWPRVEKIFFILCHTSVVWYFVLHVVVSIFCTRSMRKVGANLARSCLFSHDCNRISLSFSIKRFPIRLLFVAPERKANKQGNFVAGKAENLALYEVKLVLLLQICGLRLVLDGLLSARAIGLLFILILFPWLYCTQDEIHKRPRISTLLESLSRYEAVLSPQQDDEEGEAKTAKSSQVRVYKKVLYRQNKATSSCVFILVMQILSYGFENILNYW